MNEPNSKLSSSEKKLLVVVSGLPGTGKTYLSKEISRRLQLPLLSRDDFKESLFDSLGIADRAWSAQLGAASFDLMFLFAQQLMQVASPLILETHFWPITYDQVYTLKKEYSYRAVLIQCMAHPETAVKRYRERWEAKKRHPGHVDNENFETVEATHFQQTLYRPNFFDDVIEVDTTQLEKIDYLLICERLLTYLTGAKKTIQTGSIIESS